MAFSEGKVTYFLTKALSEGGTPFFLFVILVRMRKSISIKVVGKKIPNNNPLEDDHG